MSLASLEPPVWPPPSGLDSHVASNLDQDGIAQVVDASPEWKGIRCPLPFTWAPIGRRRKNDVETRRHQCGATFLLNSADSEELPKREMDLDKELVSVIIERRDILGPRLITGALSCVSSTARYGLSNLKFEPQC